MSRCEKKLNDKLDDEIKLAGLEALVPEELEKHLILNSNRLQTFEDARLEIVTYVEAKFGLRIRDSKQSETVTRWQSDPMRSILCHPSSKGKWLSSPRDGRFKCGGAHFQRDCNARKGNDKQSSGPKSDISSETQESAETYPTDNSHTDTSRCDDGWSYDEWNDDWNSVGCMKVGVKLVTKSRGHFHLEVSIYSKSGHEMRMHFERLVNWYGRKQLTPVYIEDSIFNLYLIKEVKSTETKIVNKSKQPGNDCGREVRSYVQRKL